MKDVPDYRGRTLLTFLKRSILFGVVVIIASTAGACAQGVSEDANWLIEVLELQEGDVAAEIGAGDGSLTLAMARRVGPEGQVYTSELGADSVQYLQNVVESAPESNITVVEGHPSQTNFPKGCCDALFMRRVYHHFDDPASMNQSIREALKPGGRVAVIDFEPRGTVSKGPEGRDSSGQHGVPADTVIEELKAAGFTLISSEKRSGRNFYVVMEKSE